LPILTDRQCLSRVVNARGLKRPPCITVARSHVRSFDPLSCSRCSPSSCPFLFALQRYDNVFFLLPALLSERVDPANKLLTLLLPPLVCLRGSGFCFFSPPGSDINPLFALIDPFFSLPWLVVLRLPKRSLPSFLPSVHVIFFSVVGFTFL